MFTAWWNLQWSFKLLYGRYYIFYNVLPAKIPQFEWLLTTYNIYISKAILSFLLILSDSAPHHSNGFLGTNFKFLKVFWFKEDRRMFDISSARIKQPFLTYFCIMIFTFICSETRRAECSKKPCMPFQFYAVSHL